MQNGRTPKECWRVEELTVERVKMERNDVKLYWLIPGGRMDVDGSQEWIENCMGMKLSRNNNKNLSENISQLPFQRRGCVAASGSGSSRRESTCSPAGIQFAADKDESQASPGI